MSDESVEFSVLCRMFEAVARSKPGLKRKHLNTFLEHVYTSHNYFSAMRLILPQLDKERAHYGLKEAVLAKLLAEALGLSKDAEDAKKLQDWRRGGKRGAGSNAGNFPLVAAEVLYRRQKTTSGGLKIKDVNSYLDRLAAAEDSKEKIAKLAELINKTNVQEMRWIIMIILKELKLGISEKTVFSVFHPDAEDLFNVTCDLKLVCERLCDRTQRYKRQDIEVGKAVRLQLASRVGSVEEAWKKLRGKEVVVECKFDGDRIQVHKNGNDIHFFSRTFIDHSEYKEAIADTLCQNILLEKCILDGEMLVWDHLNNRFAEFGSNQEIAKAAKDGLDTGQQSTDVVFDILYSGDSSVIHQPLRERQQLLQKSVHPIKGRLELLLPESGGLNENRPPGEPQWSILASSAEEVQKFFQETVDNRDEGVILKDLDSKWEPSDRSTKWLKLKPDYIHSESDLDVLIIGGYYGSGSRGGEVAQFLLGVAERPKPGGYPTKFYSFCRVGTGLTGDESEHLVNKLKPYFRQNKKNDKPPSFYVVTNAAKERPDVWIEQPEKSVILQITSDIRTIRSEVFAAPYNLRFPRVQRVRYDKPWYDCLDVQTLIETVHTRDLNLGDHEGGTLTKGRVKKARQRKPEALRSLVPLHMIVTDVSHVEQTTLIFKGLIFYFINTSPEYSTEKLHKLVVENGGTFSMNLSKAVTHSIASEKKGIKYQAAASTGDVIHYSWFLECIAKKALIPVAPKYYLQMSKVSKEKMKDDIDEFGDFYFVDVDVSDVRQLFESMDVNKQAQDMEEVKHYREKYFPTPTWCHFCSCNLYFHHPLHSNNPDMQEVAAITLRRLALEVLMHEGSVSETINQHVTHVVVYTDPESPVQYKTILQSFSASERKLLKSTSIKIVNQRWIEDSLSCNSHPYHPESDYNLRFVVLALSPAGTADKEEEELLGTTSMQVLDQDMDSAAVRPEGLKKGFLRRGRAKKAQGERTVIKSTPTPTKMKESNNTVKKRGLRRGEHEVKGEGGSSSESGEIVPRRRLKLDAASKQSGKARLAPKLAPRPSSIRVAQKRLLERKKNPIAAAEGYQEQQGNNDEGEATRLSSESGIADGKDVRQNVESGNAEGDHAKQSAESGGDRKTQGIDVAQSSVDVMLSDLFPSYVPSQRPTLDPIQEKDRLLEGASLSTIPFQNFTRDALQSPQREDANCSFETKPSAPSADRDGPVPNDAASLENSTMESVVVPTILPRLNDPSEKKQKVSYKDLVNQMLNFD
ncbi:unnamed protein product [Sphagnum troendelagicum]|uniref:DNA ligase n=1 Tax=Sphagnum troendelagicum TaxID=128251 RepID=A0ABP0UA91_9BRYO